MCTRLCCRFLSGVKPHKILPGGGIFPPENGLNGWGGYIP